MGHLGLGSGEGGSCVVYSDVKDDHLGSALLAVAPPKSLCTARLPRWWDGVRSKKALDSVSGLLSRNENMPVLPTLLLAQIQNTVRYKPVWKILTIFHPKPAHWDFFFPKKICQEELWFKSFLNLAWTCSLSLPCLLDSCKHSG